MRSYSWAESDSHSIMTSFDIRELSPSGICGANSTTSRRIALGLHPELYEEKHLGFHEILDFVKKY